MFEVNADSRDSNRAKDPRSVFKRFAKKKKTEKPRADHEEEEAAIVALAERTHPEASPHAPSRPVFAKLPEQERAQHKNEQERKKNKQLVRNFLEDYEEDMHKRRLRSKQARRLGWERKMCWCCSMAGCAPQLQDDNAMKATAAFALHTLSRRR